MSASAVYIVGVTDNPVKIGVADDPYARLSALQVGCPDELVLHHFVKVPCDIARRLERACHERLSEYSRRGEWFNIDKARAVEVLEELKRQHLMDYQCQMRGSGDLLDQLGSFFALHDRAREMVLLYRSRLDTRREHDEAWIASANGYILKQVGTAAYAAFSLVIAQQTGLHNLRGKELDRANAALARGVNALCDFAADLERAKSAAIARRARRRMGFDKAA